MNATTQQNPAPNHDDIAKLACQIWQTEGSQSGRDQEYWLRAEQQLRAISQQENTQANIAPVKRKVSSATRKNSASQPATPSGSSASIQRK
ncbi:MAG: DUF2934 domain-containing protein [Verrucomicrobiales bacterium]|nr:DUF2934 domain-containing protein [Verrucomicrobiales bacterium]